MNEVKYVLRTVGSDYKSYGGFKWPKRGKVKAPDWIDSKECGNGLHGALWGEGDGSLFSWSPNAVWQVVKVDGPCIDLGGKVKFEKGYVVYSGDQKTATDKIIKLGAKEAKGAVIGATVSSGDYGSSTSGDYGSSISGDYGSSISGAGGSSTSGDYGSSISGDFGSSISGAGGSSTSGDYGSSTSGAYGSSTSGDQGSSTSGFHGRSISGVRGSSTSGEGGTLVIKYRDSGSGRYKLKVGYVGEDGLKPNVAYRLNENHEFEEVKV